LALGEKSPGLPVLANQFELGEEAAVRRAVAASEAIADRKMRLGLVQEATSKINRPLTLAEADELMSLMKVDGSKDPETILEELYGARVVSTIPVIQSNQEAHQKALNDIPLEYLDTADAAAQHIAKNNIAKNVLEDVKAEWERQGIFSTIKQYAKQLVPFWSYANLTSAVEGANTNFSLEFGKTIQEEVDYLYSLKPSAFKKELVAAISKIAEDSPLDAMIFAEGVISYSSNDRMIDSILGAMDMTVFLLPFKGLKGAKAAATGASKDLKPIEKATEDTTRILSAVPKNNASTGTALVQQSQPVTLSPNTGIPVIWDGAKGELRIGDTGVSGSISIKGSPDLPESIYEKYPSVDRRLIDNMPAKYKDDPVKRSDYIKDVGATYDPTIRKSLVLHTAKSLEGDIDNLLGAGTGKPVSKKLINDSGLIDFVLERIRNGISKGLDTYELLGRHVAALQNVSKYLDEYLFENLSNGQKLDNKQTIALLKRFFTKKNFVSIYDKKPYATDDRYLEDFVDFYKDRRRGVTTLEASPEAKGLLNKAGYTVKVDLDKIMAGATKRAKDFDTKMYPPSERGLYEYMKDSGVPRSILDGPVHSAGATEAIVRGLLKDIPPDEELVSVIRAFMDESFDPWPYYAFSKDTAELSRAHYDAGFAGNGPMRQFPDVSKVDPDFVLEGQARKFVAGGEPLHPGAKPVAPSLAQDPGRLLEMTLWHETAHLLTAKWWDHGILTVAQNEDLVNAMAFLKLRQKRLAPGIQGSATGSFGPSQAPVPYQLKDFSRVAGGLRDPGVVKSDKPLKNGAYVVFDKGSNTVNINEPALLKQYERKPWKNSKKAGVENMPDADFTKPEDWINFSIEKVKLQATLTRAAGEQAHEFINRVNNLALQSIRAKKLEQGAVVRNQMADITRSGMEDDLGEAAARSGMVDEAADSQAMKEAKELWEGKDPLEDSTRLQAKTPSIFHVASLEGTIKNERTRRILRALERNAVKLLGIPLNNSAVVRIPESTMQVAIEEAKKSLSTTYDRVNDAFLDVSFGGPFTVVRPEEQLVNTTVVNLRMGRPDGLLFDSPSQAAVYGVDLYGLSPNGFSILQQGNGFFINIAKSVDETLDGVRDVLIDSTNKSQGGFLNAFLNLLRTPEDQLSSLQNANRKFVTTVAQELHRVMLDSSKAISKNLSKVEKDQLSAIWSRNRDYEDEATGARGYYFQTISEFEDEFVARYKAMPSEAQTEAYFTYVQLNDMDYILRNLALHRDLSRMGAENMRVFTDVMTEGGATQREASRGFAGRLIDKLPLEDTSEDFGIWVYDPRTKKGEFHLRSQVTKDISDDLNKKLSDEGFKVIEIVNPLEKPLFETARTTETIHFAVVKNYDNAKFDWNILPYRPGGHVEYGDQFFVKQPKIRRSNASGSLRHIYEGDVSILNAATSAEAQKWAKVAETARLMLRAGKEADLADFLSKNAPWDLKTFKGFFTERQNPDGTITPALLHLDDKITWTYTGRNTSDMDHFKKDLEGYENFFNGVRSKYNLFAQNVDKKYLGSRDPDLPRVEEKGTEGSPIFALAKPRLLSPLDTLNKSIANVTRSRHMNDYKTSAVESFIEEFASVMKTPIAELRRNPVYYFHNPVWDTETTNKALLSAAQATRRANIMFIGAESELGGKLFWLQTKMVDEIYKRFGQKVSNVVTEKYLPTVKDPFTYARSIAFHTKLGLFNPVQLVLQAQSFAHVAAIAGPGMALRAAGDGIRMRQLALTEEKAIIDQYARWSGNADMFRESYTELKKTGYYNVGGEVAWRDDVFEPNLFKGPLGTFLEKGTMFFDEGERFVRLAAWNAAFYAWREANPGKVIDNLTRNQILQRADLMSVNMTRASNAAWQQGLWSIPTQFLAFQARLAEQLLPGFSSRLTKQEKIRAFLTYSTLYGLPVGAGATVGVYPFYEDVRQAALERGIELDNKLLQAAHEGILSTLTSVVFGKDYNINERFGPGGTTLFKEIIKGDKPLTEVLLGASGSILGDMISSAEPATRALLSLFTPDVAPPTMEDFMEITRNISSVNNAVKAWYMYNQGIFMTKNGGIITDNNTGLDAFMTGMLGLTNRDASDTFLMLKSRKDQQKAEKEAEDEVLKWYRRAIREYNTGDEKLGDQYLRRAKAWLVTGGIQPNKYNSIISRAIKGNESLFESVREDFWRKAPPAQMEDRRKRIQEKQSSY